MTALRIPTNGAGVLDEAEDASVIAFQAPARRIQVESATVLAVHLLLQQQPIDLLSITEILSRDPGAMVCVLRMALNARTEGCPISPRVSDWIANLDLGDLLIELASHAQSRNGAKLSEVSVNCALHVGL